MDNTLQQQQSGTPERLPHCGGGDEGRPTNVTTPHMNGAATGGVAGGLIGGGGSANRLPSHRRPQTQQMSPSIEQKVLIPTQLLTLTINKDSHGYGMKVSGDNPVYVESVKPGGAAQKAGLIAGDMILKVNGVEVRSEKHTTVVQLIKSHVVVDLTVKRSQKMQRPSSVGIGPSTPLPSRDRTASITGPQPVDNAKRREMEFSKIKTLQLMLEQEKKNLENLKTTNSVNNRQDRARAETNIRKLQEQLRQVGGEESSLHFLTTSPPTIISPSSNHQTATTPQPQHSSPAFLSRFPRSLSSLSLGTRKKTEKEITSPFSNNVIAPPPVELSSSSALSPTQSISQGVHAKVPLHPHQQPALPNATPVKKRFTVSERNLKEDIPPPLPQRNPPRITPDPNTPPNEWRRNIPVSDLDHSMSASTPSPKINTPTASGGCTGNSAAAAAAKVSANKKRPKTKMKALSDPKMSTQMFLQMEKEGSGGDNIDSCTPPPLPPRQPGMMEENQNILNSCKMSGSGGIQNRPLPNSVDTLMKYPLVATCTSVRDNMSAAFPLSQRPNIVQQLQQHQQHLHQLHHNPSTHSSSSVSKPTVLGQTPPQHMNHLHKHRRVVSSPEHMQPRHERHLDFSDRHNKSSSGSWELIEKDNEVTPPGTPPPPYLSSSHLTQSQTVHHGDDPEQLFIDHSTTAIASPTHPTFPNQILAAQANTIQKEIISMEDEEISDQECIDEHGPFNYLQRLLEPEHVAHLAVFLNYVLSNSDPAPLLFYLITGLYKEGTVKDMRKWAYEIHSTFLVPCAPLLWFNVDESLAREVDNVLQNEYDKAEILRKVFWKSRKKAKEKICDQLRDFQQKRTAGLGTMYGPSDQQLAEAKNDKVQQQKIFEDHILPKLQNLVDELDKEAPYECPKKLALCSALSTVLHRIFVTRSLPGSPIDRVHHFVSREKSFKSRLMGKNRKMVVRGHPLVLRQYYEVTHCNHCQTIIWGVSPQGYHCTDCKLNIHRPCSKVLEESCPGPVPQKRKEQHSDKKISKFMGKIRPTHSSQNERRRMDEDSVMDDFLGVDRPHSTSVVRQPSDRRPDLTNTSINSGGTASHNTSELTTSQYLDADTSALDAEHDSKRGDRSKSKSAPVSVNRSESYKERLSHKRNRNNRRKTSDPSLSKTNDEQTEVGLSNDNYTASSSSSISSGSLESPSSSLEQVSGPGGHAAVGGPMTTATGTVPTPRQWVDSEDEAELIELDWSSHVSPEILAALSDAEKKRQEIINEIFQTERNHVRTLRLLEGLFMRPLQESNVLPHDHLQILFPPALLSLKDLHSSFEQKLKLRRVENGHIVRYVGDLLVGMFEGHSGDDLREYAAQFCARQQIALEALKEKRRKDENLQRLLTKAESHKACRRLQLKDLLPTVLQRLTKYPLLFENLYKITKRVNPDDEREADAIQRALDSSKRILVDVNQAVKSAEDAHKLQTIQRKLDKSSFDKDASNEFKNLDLTQFKLVYDGQLTMKKNPGVQLHGLLFENMMVLLQKQDDKYFLKYFPNLAAGTNENNKLISPITHFDQQTLVRQSAVDKNTFFLIITKTSQMLELRAPSSSECKTWFKHISDAAEQYKPRSKSSHEVVEDPATSTLPHSNTKESLEAAATSTTERSASTAGSNNNFNVDTTTTSGYQQQDQSQINATSTPSEKAKITYSNNNNTTLDTQRGGDSKYESNNNAANQKLDGSDDKGGITTSNQNELRRDSVYSNNSNNTRTLMQHCPLLEPSEIQISISPALTAEPVLTPTEKLRRLDESIRERLAEKQKIICDMFRVPNEHFAAIADIAAQPEAPKDPSDIVLAAFAQVQSLTEVLSEYMKITPEQEISAVSTAVCDQCHQRSLRSVSPLPSSIASTNTGTTVLSYPDAGGISGGCISSSNKDDLEFAIVLEDDGYCEIDPLRLPSVMPNPNQTTPGLKPLPPPPTSTSGHISTSTPELIKRQSTISADSIPEESEQDITHEEQLNNSNSMAKDKNNSTLQSDTSTDENQKITDDSLGSEHIEVNETYDSAASLNKGISTSNLIKASNNQLCTVFATELELCGPNRLTHVQNLEPSIPCHVISGFVTALSAQISLLLPKINERDIERERLRRENQHLRELLNAMHERQRVEEEKETPDNTKSAENSEEIPDKIPEQQPPTLSPEQE